jgi:ParB-like chromosome segregation protein Spo0J
MNLFDGSILDKAKSIVADIAKLDTDERVEILNQMRIMLHAVSPLKDEPVDCVIWVKSEEVRANDYNPNSVAPPEMKLLEHSIVSDGYTQPIVTFEEDGMKTVIDGFHRNRVGKECERVKKRILGYLPVVIINQDRTERSDRVASTIRHNRARGKHRIDLMSDIIVDLKRRNWSDEKIGNELGMDPDEILRLSQISGLAEMFADAEFSKAWEADQINETDDLSTNEESEII